MSTTRDIDFNGWSCAQDSWQDRDRVMAYGIYFESRVGKFYESPQRHIIPVCELRRLHHFASENRFPWVYSVINQGAPKLQTLEGVYVLPDFFCTGLLHDDPHNDFWTQHKTVWLEVKYTEKEDAVLTQQEAQRQMPTLAPVETHQVLAGCGVFSIKKRLVRDYMAVEKVTGHPVGLALAYKPENVLLFGVLSTLQVHEERKIDYGGKEGAVEEIVYTLPQMTRVATLSDIGSLEPTEQEIKEAKKYLNWKYR